MVNERKACDMSKVSEFCVEKKHKTCMSMDLNIICLIFVNIHCTCHYAKIDQYTRYTVSQKSDTDVR